MNRRFAILVSVLGVTACRSSDSGGSRTVIVSTFAGDQAEPGALVVGHAPNGVIIDQTTADAVGHAAVGVDDDSLVTVVFPGTLSSISPVVSLVTVPATTDELTIHGPAHGPAPLIVGVLQVDAPKLTQATYFDMQIGCATVRATKLPVSFDVGSCSLGSDTNLDVLVTASHDLGGDPSRPQLDGYAAARVPMTNGVATFDIPTWQTTGTSVPVTLDGVTPVVTMELLSDGLSFGAQPVTDHGTLWSGLTIDATRITASLGGIDAARVTTRELTGAPSAIAFTADDFLPPVAVSAALPTTSPLTFTWDDAGLGDAVNLHTTWEVDAAVASAVPAGPHRVIWDAVLPPDATTVTLPKLDLAAPITPVNIAASDVLVRYVESPAHEGFAALLAAGVHAEDTDQPSTIAPRPVDGELRVSHAIGLR